MKEILLHLYQAINFRVIRLFSMTRGQSTFEKVVYLTFDDGPEPEITPAVLDILDRVGAKATFFNMGCKNEAYPEILQEIKRRGHAVGNHSYSHPKGLTTSLKAYISDMERAHQTYPTRLIRPPYGASSLAQFYALSKKGRIVLWNKGSNDHDNDMTDYPAEVNRLIAETENGDIVLFHDKQEHARQTLQILPAYVQWLSENGYQMKALDEKGC